MGTVIVDMIPTTNSANADSRFLLNDTTAMMVTNQSHTGVRGITYSTGMQAYTDNTTNIYSTSAEQSHDTPPIFDIPDANSVKKCRSG